GGGTQVTITGTGFSGTSPTWSASAVSFGGVAATSFVVVNSTTITAVSPAEAQGTVDVLVTNPGGTSGVVAGDHFTFDPTLTPTVTSVSPTTGSTVGGASVIVTGTNFTTTAAAVSFGSTAASTFTVNSSTQITVTSPAVASPGAVDVRVTNSVG